MEDPDNFKKHEAKRAMLGESRRKLLWIWMATALGSKGDSDAQMHDGE